MEAYDFSYQCGRVTTHAPWFPPDPLLLNAWRDEFFLVPGVENYTFWLCGAAMESWPTMDTDILVTGDITNYHELENILASAMQIGFKYRQFIDIAWNDYYKKYLIKGPCQRRAICCEYFYEHNTCTVEQCTAIAKDICTIVVGNQIIKNNIIINPGDPEALQLNDSLWQVHFSSPSPKQIKRIQDGFVYTSRPTIIHTQTDFKQLITWHCNLNSF